jgi:hypothetical protein
MPRGANPKREREYKKLEHRFEKEGRYPGREEEVASRIVNKQRSRFGETKSEKAKDKKGQSPDRNLPIKNYQHLTIDEIVPKLDNLSAKERKEVRRYEENHKHRKTLLSKLK